MTPWFADSALGQTKNTTALDPTPWNTVAVAVGCGSGLCPFRFLPVNLIRIGVKRC